MFKFLDVSGVGSSGKSAVLDLLTEVDSVMVSDTNFEFDFFRVQGGVLDLRQAVVTNWSPIRSNSAVNLFRKRIRSMGINPGRFDLSGLIESSSQRYDSRFNDLFVSEFEAFCDSLIIGKYTSVWPYMDLDKNPLTRFFCKILFRLGFKHINEHEICLVDGTGFDAKLQKVMEKLFSFSVKPASSWVTLNNGFEPYNPLPALDALKGSRQIVVLRDPRDIYVGGKVSAPVVENKKIFSLGRATENLSFLACDDIDVFITRYDLYLRNVMRLDDSRVLKVYFEDLCLDYENSKQKIFEFLNINDSLHLHKGKRFSPEKSAKNIFSWRSYSNKDEIAHIEKRLSSYLYKS